MHATDFWAADARKVLGKSRMRATYIPDARNPFNRQWIQTIYNICGLTNILGLASSNNQVFLTTSEKYTY